MWKKRFLAKRQYGPGAQLEGGWRGGGLPCPFLKIKKNCPDFRKKDPDCVHPFVKFAIYNVILRVSSRRDFKLFPCGNFFSGIFDEIFIGVPLSRKVPSLKYFWLRAWGPPNNPCREFLLCL